MGRSAWPVQRPPSEIMVLSMKIGLVGFGAIGGYLAKELGQSIAWIYDADSNAKARAEAGLASKFVASIPPKCGGVDLVVEAASQSAVPLLVDCLKHSDVMVMSVGAFADPKVLSSLVAAAEKNGRRIYLPSGAIGGLDALSAVDGKAASVLLETIKPPASLGRKDVKRIVVFEGDAAEACRLYPKNVNVSATLSLAGIGFARTRVRIISDPKAKNNTHRVTVESEAGKMVLEFENVPSPENPKTSALAALAAVARVRKINSTLQIG